MDRGAWCATVLGVEKSRTRLKYAHIHLLKRLCHFVIPPRVNEYYCFHSQSTEWTQNAVLSILCMVTNVFFTQAHETGMTIPHS